VRPDDVYCFGEQCSQILPPLTKHQLFITGVISCALFIVTIFLYIVIFSGVRKQANKLQQRLYQSRIPTLKSPTFRNEPPRSPSTFRKTPASPRVPGWRKNFRSVNEEATPTQKQRFSFSQCNPTFELGEMANSNSTQQQTPILDFSNVMNRQESSATTLTDLSLNSTPTPSKEFNQFQGIPNVKSDPKANSESGKNAPKSELLTVQASVRPRTLQTDKSYEKMEENRKSHISTFIGRLTRRSKRRTIASRKRDLRVMRSMFIILSVFIATTGPLMLFVIYTFPYNERDLKEIFNYLLQVRD